MRPTTWVLSVLLVTAVILIGGCAAERRSNAALEQARAAYRDADSSPDVKAQAPVALHEAQRSLDRAQQAFDDGDDDEDVNALSYVTQRNVDVAHEVARRKQAEQEMSGVFQTEGGPAATGYFPTGSAELTPGARRELNKVAANVGRESDRRVMVEGHTDSTGGKQVNQKLSERRADAARAYLVRNGVPSDRITTCGLGPSDPAAGNDTAGGRQQNRRVDVLVQTVTGAGNATAGAGRRTGPPPAD